MIKKIKDFFYITIIYFTINMIGFVIVKYANC